MDILARATREGDNTLGFRSIRVCLLTTRHWTADSVVENQSANSALLQLVEAN
jgi:hypothetical protein